ncbi:MAG: homoserine kinase [Flavobacteriaceae bacterium]
MESITIFAPASVANINCGFDALGLCLEGVGDRMVFHAVAEKELKIIKISGAELSYELSENVVGIAAEKLYKDLNLDFGIHIEIHKGIVPGSGIGSSSASAAGAVLGVNALAGNPLSKMQLMPYALEGEAYASGQKHADNVAPALLGGLQLIRDHESMDLIDLPIPQELSVLVLHPEIEIKTSEARSILPKEIPLKDSVRQSAHFASFIAGIYGEDYELIKRASKDFIVEPHRKKLIPGFDILNQSAMSNGALSFGISGSGPSVFALLNFDSDVLAIKNSWAAQMEAQGFSFQIYHSQINPYGSQIIPCHEVLQSK